MTTGRIIAAVGAVFAAGVVLLVVTDVVIVNAIGWALVGIAGVLVVALAFLLVGQSEDRDRARHSDG